MIIAPIGFYDSIVQDELTSVQASQMTAGDLITAGKLILPNVVRTQGGAALLKEFWLLQQDTLGGTDLEKDITELYVFDNETALGALVSGSPFALDATTKITNIVYHKIFAANEWVTTKDGANCYLRITDINAYCQVIDPAQYSLGYCLVTGGTPTFSNHTLTTRFSFEQIKVKD